MFRDPIAIEDRRKAGAEIRDGDGVHLDRGMVHERIGTIPETFAYPGQRHPEQRLLMSDIHVRRLPRDTGPAGWSELLSPMLETPSLAGDQNVDWLVIGAGFAGFAAARRLSKNNPSDSIDLLDAVRIGEGPGA